MSETKDWSELSGREKAESFGCLAAILIVGVVVIGLVVGVLFGGDGDQATVTPAKAPVAAQEADESSDSKATPSATEDAAEVRSVLREGEIWKTFGMAYSASLVAVDGDALIVGTNRVEGTDRADGARFLICDRLDDLVPEILSRRTVQIAGFAEGGGAASLGICG